MKDIRPRAEEKARKRAEELRSRQSGDNRPPGSGFETERARAKQALRAEVNAQTGQSVQKIAASSSASGTDTNERSDRHPQYQKRGQAFIYGAGISFLLRFFALSDLYLSLMKRPIII